MPEQEQNLSELKKVRLEKMNELRSMGLDPFGQRFERNTLTKPIIEGFEQWENQTARVAGRIMSKRRHGKAGFAHLQDIAGRIQLYFRRDDLGEEQYELYKKLDIGDLVGIEGRVSGPRRARSAFM